MDHGRISLNPEAEGCVTIGKLLCTVPYLAWGSLYMEGLPLHTNDTRALPLLSPLLLILLKAGETALANLGMEQVDIFVRIRTGQYTCTYFILGFRFGYQSCPGGGWEDPQPKVSPLGGARLLMLARWASSRAL